jgi:hypothetical protein
MFYGALPLRYEGVFFTVATRGNGTELNPDKPDLLTCHVPTEP